MKTVSLSEQDIDDISRVVETEVGSQYRTKDPVGYSRMVAGVVDTVVNRVAAGYAPNVRGVINADRQFSKIAGPAREKPYGSIQKAPKAPAATKNYVEQHLAERAMGKPSIIGGALDYANVKAVDKANKKPNSWSQRMTRETPTVALGVKGLGTHNHGLAPGNDPAPEYSLSVPKSLTSRVATAGPQQKYAANVPANLAYSKPEQQPAPLPDDGPRARIAVRDEAGRLLSPTPATRVASVPASAPRLASPVANALTGPARPQNAAAAIDRMLSAPKTAPARAPAVAAYSAVPASARVANAPQRVASAAPVSATVSTARPAAVANNPTPIKGIDITPAPRSVPAAVSSMADRGRRVAPSTAMSAATAANVASRLGPAMAEQGPRLAPSNAISAAQAANLAGRLDAAAPRVASVPSAPQPSRVASALSTIGRAIGPSPAAAATMPGAVSANVPNSARIANVPTAARPANVSTSPVAARVSQTTAPAPKVSAAMPANVPSTAKPAAIADTSRRLSPTFSNTVDMQGWSADQKQRTIASLTNPDNAGYLSRPKPTMGPNLPQGPQLPAGMAIAKAAPVTAPRPAAALPSLAAPVSVPARQVAAVQPVTRQPVTQPVNRPAVQPLAMRPAPAVTPARAVVQNAISSAPRLGAPSIPNAPAQPGLLGRVGSFFSNNAPRAIGAVVGGAVLGPVGGLLGGYLGNRLGNGPAMSNAARAAMDSGQFDGFGYGPSASSPSASSGSRGGNGGLGGLGGMSSGPSSGIGGNGSNFGGSSFGGGRNATGGNNNTSSKSSGSSKSGGGKKK